MYRSLRSPRTQRTVRPHGADADILSGLIAASSTVKITGICAPEKSRTHSLSVGPLKWVLQGQNASLDFHGGRIP
jgi:hypothetical protein